jgi:hypothetical protein
LLFWSGYALFVDHCAGRFIVGNGRLTDHCFREFVNGIRALAAAPPPTSWPAL